MALAVSCGPSLDGLVGVSSRVADVTVRKSAVSQNHHVVDVRGPRWIRDSSATGAALWKQGPNALRFPFLKTAYRYTSQRQRLQLLGSASGSCTVDYGGRKQGSGCRPRRGAPASATPVDEGRWIADQDLAAPMEDTRPLILPSLKRRGAHSYKGDGPTADPLDDVQRAWGDRITSFKDDAAPPPAPSKPGQLPPRAPRNRADDAALHNPLQRLERMGCGWLAVIFEWEGVIVEDEPALEAKAWAALAEEERRPPPPAFVLRRAAGMKGEQAVAEVLCWARDPRTVRHLAARKAEIQEGMQGGTYRLRPGAREFVETMRKYGMSIAVASTRPRRHLEAAIEAVGMEGFFGAVVAADDVYRGKPDPEMFQYCAQLLGFIPERCIMVGNNNHSIEAAHDALMKCVAVVGKHPAYELGAADLVVQRLNDLSVVDLKNLADLESPEFLAPEALAEVEFEEEADRSSLPVALADLDRL